MRARRHQIVARAFRRRLGQDRRLDVDEAVGIHEVADAFDHVMTQTQVLLHLRATQIDIAILEARVLTDRSEEHTSELQSLMRISYAVFCLKKKKHQT